MPKSEMTARRSGAAATGGGRVVAVVSDDRAPLLGPLRQAAPALLAGATLVLKPSPKAPSAVFALAELTARSGFPGGAGTPTLGAALRNAARSRMVGRLSFVSG